MLSLAVYVLMSKDENFTFNLTFQVQIESHIAIVFSESREHYTYIMTGIYLPAWKSIPTAKAVPDIGIRASILSLGSRGIPRIPS